MHPSQKASRTARICTVKEDTAMNSFFQHLVCVSIGVRSCNKEVLQVAR